jgi:fibronectin type 3 domain-containing protein
MAQRLGKLLVFGILLSSAGGAQSVRLAWDPVPEYWIAGYHLYRSPQEGGPWQRVNLDLIPETWYLDETVESGETWYYSVTAVNTFGAESALSTPVRVVVGGSRPAVSLGADRDAVTGEVVILTAQVTGFASAPTYAWEQTAGPPAAMVSPTPGTLVFTAPETETEIVLEFRVRADTSPGESALSSLRIRILPRP